MAFFDLEHHNFIKRSTAVRYYRRQCAYVEAFAQAERVYSMKGWYPTVRTFTSVRYFILYEHRRPKRRWFSNP